MNNMKTIEIKCLNPKCTHWFSSPIFFSNIESLDSCSMSGNKAQCPKCGTMTECNKENMRARATNGGFIGEKTN